jgi:hypothetical protein
MRPIAKETIWANEHGITPRQVHRLGGYERLMELEKNHPETFALMISDAKNKRSRYGRKVAA